MHNTGCVVPQNTQDGAAFFRLSMENIEGWIGKIREKVRSLYYRAVLLTKACPACGVADLAMVRDSWCRCDACGHECDPTLNFEVCPDCLGKVVRQIQHYWCPTCRQRVVSIYCFDAKLFDAAYFREMMRQCRERKHQKQEDIRQMLALSRSPALGPMDEPCLDSVPGLEAALNAFVDMPVSLASFLEPTQRPRFDLQRYQEHVLELASGCTVRFEGISALVEDARLDRVFRFIAVIFLDHDGQIEITQDCTGKIILRGR